MARRYNESFNIERNSSMINIGGELITYAEYQQRRKKAKRDALKDTPKKRKKKVYGDIQLIPSTIAELLKNAKVIKSLASYYDNGYKQWGRISREIIDNREVRPHYVSFRVRARELNVLLDEIDEMSKKKSKDVYQYVEKVSYKVDDILTSLNSLMKGVEESRVCEFFKGHECIEGSKDGKRLGLAPLMIRTSLSVTSMQKTIKELMQIAIDGADINNYALNGSYIAR